MSANRHTPKPHERGFALMTTIILTVVLLVLVGGLLESLSAELHNVGAHSESNAALRAAYAGVEDMVSQFEYNDSGPAIAQVPASQAKTYTDDNGNTVDYSVSVDSKRWNTTLPHYLLHSVGTANGMTRSVDALIRKQPYSAFQRFTISENDNKGGKLWYLNGQVYNGPVYSGGPMNIRYTDGQAPIFTGDVYTATTPNWYDVIQGQSRAPTTDSDWAAIMAGGAAAFHPSTSLSLPSANDNQLVADEALYGEPKRPNNAPPRPTQPGLYINDEALDQQSSNTLTSGLYVVGDVTLASAGNAAANTETLTLTGSGFKYEVDVNFNANTTIVKDLNAGGQQVANFSGVPSGQTPSMSAKANGAIFVTGKVTVAANSSIHGQYTLAVPDSKNNAVNPDITLLGSVTYADKSPTSLDTLAMWANDINLNDMTNEDPEIDGMLLTGYAGECAAVCNDGTFSNVNCGAGSCTGGVGTVKIVGSLVQNVRGKLGRESPVRSGFRPSGSYDPRLSKMPPPFTPTLNVYEVVALCAVDAGNGTCGQN